MLTTDRHTDRFRDIGDIPEGKEGADTVAPSTLDKSTRAALTKIGAAMFRTGTNARQLFSEIDTNNDGTLSSHEFAAALAKLNLDFSKPDLRRILEAIDTNGSGKIDYMESAGEEAKEGRLLVEALLSNVGALWDESRSVLFMMRSWQQTCTEADADKSGTISEEEAATIWASVLTSFTQFVQEKLQALGVRPMQHNKKVAQRPFMQQV